MTFLEAQRAPRRGGHRLIDAGRTPNGLPRAAADVDALAAALRASGEWAGSAS